MFSKKKTECRVCGYRFTPERENIYTAEEPRSALEIIKCKEGNKEFMKERPARRPFGNTVLICEYPIDDTAAEEPNAKLITWRLAKRAARDFLRVSFMPSAIVSAATHGGKTAVRVYGKY